MIVEALPESLKDMARVIGLTQALALVALRGGVRISVPQKYDAEHWLDEAIGPAPFQKMIAYYGGDLIDIPKGQAAFQAIRQSEIVRDRKAGLSNAQLAVKYEMTVRGVRKLLARSKATLEA
jgi:hypothetical protein